MQRKFIVSIFFALFLVNILPAQQLRFQKNHPLSARDTITDRSIVFPEDMERNYDQLLFDWNKEFIPSRNCFKGSDDNIIYPDSVYVNRLYALPTIMEMAYNQVTRAYIDMYTDRKRTQVEYMLARGKYFFPIFEQALDKYGVPMELKFLPVIESALNPTALSRAGASGLWQFMAPTGKRYDLEVNSLVDERRDPVKATDAAARYLRDMYRIYGDWNLVIAAYNCGPGNVNKAIRRSGGKKDYWEIYPYLPRETRGYVPAFIAANYVMNYYKYHNLCPLEYSEKETTDTIHVNKTLNLQQIAGLLNIPIEKLREMNPQFKNDIVPGEFRTYAVTLPSKRVCDFISNEDSIYAYHADEFLVHRKIVNYATLPTPEYITRTIYHSVKRGETLAQVARQYGVSSSELKQWNRLRSSHVKSGRRLAIKTRIRVKTPENESSSKDPQQDNSSDEDSSDSTQNSSTFAQLQGLGRGVSQDTESAAVIEDNGTENAETEQSAEPVTSPVKIQKKEAAIQTSKVSPRNEKAKFDNPKPEVSKDAKTVASRGTIHHKVVSGETLSKIAETYNVSIEDVSDWNNLKKSIVKVGQDLIIHTSKSQPELASSATKNRNEGDNPLYHKVQSGETLGKIAEKYNVSKEDIQKWNNMKGSSIVKVGQELAVSETLVKKNAESNHEANQNPVYHKVKSGETLGKIAEKYNVSQDQLKEWNNMSSSVVKVGQQLVVDNGARHGEQLTSNDVPDNNQSSMKFKNRRRPEPKYYFVKRGDTLLSIAEKYTDSSVRDIKLANNLKTDKLSVGQKLKIPVASR